MAFPMGTDNLGRDILSRVIYGAQISMLVGFLSTIFGTGLGAVVALLSGYAGGRWDLLVQRVMDILWSFPSLIIAIVIIAVLGRSSTNLIVAIGIVVIPSTARVVRSAVLAVKGDRVCAGRSGSWRKPFAHHRSPCCAELRRTLHRHRDGEPWRGDNHGGVVEFSRLGNTAAGAVLGA